jgi:hypothetical protein
VVALAPGPVVVDHLEAEPVIQRRRLRRDARDDDVARGDLTVAGTSGEGGGMAERANRLVSQLYSITSRRSPLLCRSCGAAVEVRGRAIIFRPPLEKRLKACPASWERDC